MLSLMTALNVRTVCGCVRFMRCHAAVVMKFMCIIVINTDSKGKMCCSLCGIESVLNIDFQALYTNSSKNGSVSKCANICAKLWTFCLTW